MRITIGQRLRPYSHSPGTHLVIPGSGKSVTVYPARLCLESVGEIRLHIIGPVKDFTTCLDLEIGCIRVWGHSGNGYFRYVLNATSLKAEKVPDGGLILTWEQDQRTEILQAGDSITIGAGHNLPHDAERLSLGSHKALDWEHVTRRCEAEDIFPVWFRLGRLLSCSDPLKGSGTTHLLQNGKLIDLFKAGFNGILHPQLVDSLHQGYDLPPPLPGENPLNLLTAGSTAIRSLFIQQQGNDVYLLPSLPVELHCGRFLNVGCGDASSIDFEWSKKLIRRVIFRCGQSGSWLFHFQKQIKSYRLRRAENSQDKGRWIDCDTPLDCLADRTYYLDNFQKR